MSELRPFGPGMANQCIVCDLLDGQCDPATMWAAGWASGVARSITPVFCIHHAGLAATALRVVGLPPEGCVRLNLATDRSKS